METGKLGSHEQRNPAQPTDWGQRLGLSLAGPLEAAYREHQQQRAISLYRFNILIIFLLWLLVSIGIYVLMPEAQQSLWLRLYGAVGMVIIVSGVFSWVPALDRWFNIYLGLGCFVAVALSVAITGVLPDLLSGQLTVAAVIFCMVIVYALVGLPFGWTVLVACLGGAAGVLLSSRLGGAINVDIFLVAYGGGSCLGICIAYYAERNSRALFVLQKEHIAQLEHLSCEDSLTGLANRRHLDRVLNQEWRRAFRKQAPLAVMMIDIDRFKHYNDHFGHLMGDECLRLVAAILARHARRPGEMAARYGGEEFLLLLPDTDMNEAIEHAERILTEIRAARIAHAPTAGRPAVSASIGVAVAVPFDHWTPAFLLEAADSAMYVAKRDGGDCCRLSGLRLSPTTKTSSLPAASTAAKMERSLRSDSADMAAAPPPP
jgi:diguanylate cyclase (GGDEF)-like protein